MADSKELPALKKQKQEPINAVPTREERPTYFRVTEEEAEKFKVGDKLNVALSGTIKSMRGASMHDEPNKMIEVELASPEINSLAMNAADYEVKRMMNG